MDHSPSEQLGSADAWHTTALILSVSGEQWRLGDTVAEAMGIQSGHLKKWSKCKPSQKKRFETEFFKTLASSSMYVAAISAQASTIEATFDHMISELGLTGLLVPLQRNDKPYLEFGPFLKLEADSSTTEVRFPIHRAQALALVFITHFIARMHQKLLAQLNQEDPGVEWMDWQISADKLAGGLEGRMSSLFFALMGLLPQAKIVSGNLRGHTHLDGDQGTDLADNIAGMLQDGMSLNPASPLLTHEKAILREGALYWERWIPE